MARRKLRKFDKDFKVKVCKMVIEDDIPAAAIGKEYDIMVQVIYRWLKEYETYGDEAFMGSGKLRPKEAKIKELEKELEETKMELEILKKTAQYFLDRNGKE